MVTSNNIEQMADSAGLGARGVGENGVDRAGSRHGVQSSLARGARRAARLWPRPHLSLPCSGLACAQPKRTELGAAAA